MSSVIISGDTSGSVTLQAPATAGSTTLTLPAVSGTVVLNNSADQTINGLTVGKGAGLESGSTVLGNGALAGSNTGANNLAVGRNSLAVNTSGAQNSALGYATLNANTTGADNVAVGHIALYGNTTGSSNVAVGRQALQANTTASYNTAVGYQAGYSNTTGTQQTSFGYLAGYASTGNYCTFIGGQAGQATTGNNNTFLGQGSGAAITTGAKNTIIGIYGGNQGGLDIRTSSNYIVLSDGDGNPRGIFDANGAFHVGGEQAPQTPDAPSITSTTTDAGNQCVTLWNKAVSGTRYLAYFGVNTTFLNIGAITSNGSTTSYVTTSDYRLKEDVAPMVGALETVSKLKPVTYRWKESGIEDNGFIAHELQEVLPNAVVGEKDAVNEDGSIDPQAIDTSFLVATLTAAIQELNAKVIELEAKLESK